MEDAEPNPDRETPQGSFTKTAAWTASFLAVTLLYLTGPTFNVWPLAFVAFVPVILVARTELARQKMPIYMAFFLYYLVSLQGLRHAHTLMVFPLIAMAGYLAIYPVVFVGLLRRWFLWTSRIVNTVAESGHESGIRNKPKIVVRIVLSLPVSLIAASIWVGGEWVRNYVATGISVLMLGHSLTGMNPPLLIQIADLFGTYGVSFLLIVCHVAVADIVLLRYQKIEPSVASDAIGRFQRIGSNAATSVPIACVLLILSTWYGITCLRYPTTVSNTTILLVGRDEQTEYEQDLQREQEIFANYARQTIESVRQSDVPVDVVVWPESMFAGGMAWTVAEEDLVVPEPLQAESISPAQMRGMISQTQQDFLYRASNLQAAMTSEAEQKTGVERYIPAIIGGCGIVRYGQTPRQYSGVIHITPDGNVGGTYEKNHLVMFGETIPLIRSIPILKNFVPMGLGLNAGTTPSVFSVGTLLLMPNLCIETAVERIAVNHMHHFYRESGSIDSMPDVIVTLTNDAWFDHAEVVRHHLRCAQMVAIACRRPVLSAANGGPTAWIDSSGRIVEAIPLDESGVILASPQLDDRVSFYVRSGSVPPALMALGWVMGVVWVGWRKWRTRRRRART